MTHCEYFHVCNYFPGRYTVRLQGLEYTRPPQKSLLCLCVFMSCRSFFSVFKHWNFKMCFFFTPLMLWFHFQQLCVRGDTCSGRGVWRIYFPWPAAPWWQLCERHRRREIIGADILPPHPSLITHSGIMALLFLLRPPRRWRLLSGRWKLLFAAPGADMAD